MAKGKIQRIVECPECFHHFDRSKDPLNRLCIRCNQWRPAIDFTDVASVCKVCKGTHINRFSTQLRLRTKAGDLLKQCKKCGLWKPEGNYTKDSGAKDGLQNWCVDCNSKFQAEQRAETKHPQMAGIS